MTLKEEIRAKAKELGATLVGFSNVARYREYYPDSPTVFHPDRIWPEAKSVVVMAVPMPLPIVESTPSINYQELYTTSNIMLDRIAYDLVLRLMEKGHPAIWAPRDCYSDLKYLVNNAMSSFSHVIAGYLAGLGTIGWNHTLLTKEYGPRHRLVSVLTSAEIEPDEVMKKKPLSALRRLPQALSGSGAHGRPQGPVRQDGHERLHRPASGAQRGGKLALRNLHKGLPGRGRPQILEPPRRETIL